LTDVSLVDPDNRRSVDFAARLRCLSEPEAHLRPTKLGILRRALALRRQQPDLFARGRYHPLAVEGPGSSHVLAYGRVDGERVAVTVVTRLLGRELARAGAPVLPAAAWSDTAIALPRDWHRLPWRDRLTDASVAIADGRVLVSRILDRGPVALLATV
jgi:(1->4)-alpha-D-glucan 1-alpha-D-glucosylmutase